MNRAILILALLFVAITAALLPSRLAVPPEITFSNDSGSYHRGALHLARSWFYSVDGVTATSGREPSYSLFLAGIYKVFGEGNRSAIFIAQATLYLASVLFFLKEFRSIGGKTATTIAGAFLLLSPSTFHSIFMVYREIFALSLFLLFIAMLFRATRMWSNWPLIIGAMFLGGFILTYISFMFLPLFLLPAFVFFRFRPFHIALLIGIPLLCLVAWGTRNARVSEWQLLNPVRSAAIWSMRAMHAEVQDPLDPLRCVWVEYVSRDRSQEPAEGICRPETVRYTAWIEAFPKTIAGARALQRESYRHILRHLPMYLWGSLVWGMEYHFPFLNGWGRTYNIMVSIGALIIYSGILLFLWNIKKLWRKEYWFLVLPILYGTLLFSLTQGLPRYRMPTLFCYAAISAVGYAFLSTSRTSSSTPPGDSSTETFRGGDEEEK